MGLWGRGAGESQVPAWGAGSFGLLSADLTTPGPAVRLRPLALLLARRKPQNFLLRESPSWKCLVAPQNHIWVSRRILGARLYE